MKKIHNKRGRLFQKFLKYTNEKRILSKEIIKLMKPKRSWSFLDVGCGNGDITLHIAKIVSRTVALDDNKKLLNQFRRKAKLLKKIKFLHRDWTKVDFLGEFDLVVASHILLYPSFEHRWKSTIRKLLRHVKKGGKLLIIHHSKTGEYLKMLREFFFKIRKVHSSEYEQRDYKYVADMVKLMGYKPKTKVIETFIMIPSMKEVLELVDWFFHKSFKEIKPSTQKELIEYFNSLKKDGKIIIEVNHGFIWIRK